MYDVLCDLLYGLERPITLQSTQIMPWQTSALTATALPQAQYVLIPSQKPASN